MIFKKKNYFYFTFFRKENENVRHSCGIIETYEKKFPFSQCEKMIKEKFKCNNFQINFFSQICIDDFEIGIYSMFTTLPS